SARPEGRRSRQVPGAVQVPGGRDPQRVHGRGERHPGRGLRRHRPRLPHQDVRADAGGAEAGGERAHVVRDAV
ncbi:unnamed protein product, partial [Heterosigma akashiwo]